MFARWRKNIHSEVPLQPSHGPGRYVSSDREQGPPPPLHSRHDYAEVVSLAVRCPSGVCVALTWTSHWAGQLAATESRAHHLTATEPSPLRCGIDLHHCNIRRHHFRHQGLQNARAMHARTHARAQARTHTCALTPACSIEYVSTGARTHDRARAHMCQA